MGSTNGRLFYYVTAEHSGRHELVTGPYASHAEALADVSRVRKLAYTKEARSWRWAWGTYGSDLRYATVLGKPEKF